MLNIKEKTVRILDDQPRKSRLLTPGKTKTCLELGGDGILVHVDVVLVDRGHDELIALRLHPGGHEGRQVQPRVSVQHQLVFYDLVCCFLWDGVVSHLEPEIKHSFIISIPSIVL